MPRKKSIRSIEVSTPTIESDRHAYSVKLTILADGHVELEEVMSKVIYALVENNLPVAIGIGNEILNLTAKNSKRGGPRFLGFGGKKWSKRAKTIPVFTT